MSTKEIGKILAEARQSKGLSQADISAQLGVSQRTVSAYEKGERRIHAEQLLKFAAITNISLDLLAGSPSKIDGRSKSARILKELEKLPPEDQKVISNMIDSLSSKQSKKD